MYGLSFLYGTKTFLPGRWELRGLLQMSYILFFLNEGWTMEPDKLSIQMLIFYCDKRCFASFFRSSRPEVFSEISQHSQENTCARVSFLIKLQASGLRLWLRDSGAGVFQWILQNFKKHFFYRALLVVGSGDVSAYFGKTCELTLIRMTNL